MFILISRYVDLIVVIIVYVYVRSRTNEQIPQIVEVVEESVSSQQCADYLVGQVMQLTQYNDDIDNTTVVVVHLP
jgi:hypothetical protein